MFVDELMKDATIDDFLDAPEEDALEKKEKPQEVQSPDSQFEEFEEPERTPEKKAAEPEKTAVDTKTEEPVKKVEEPVKKAEPEPVTRKISDMSHIFSMHVRLRKSGNQSLKGKSLRISSQ